MYQLKTCMFACLAISCLIRHVVPIPAILTDGELDYDTVAIPITDDMFDLKDKKEMFDTPLLSRFRRQNSQWYVGSHHFNDYNHEGGSRRWTHRRNNNRHLGGGQIVDA